LDFTEDKGVRLLAGSDVRLFRSIPEDARIRLTLGDERSWLNVTIACAFPFSDPDRYVGLQDGAGTDIGMIVDLDGLDTQSRAIVAEQIDRRYFTPTIKRVTKVKESQSVVNFEVETDRGDRKFVVRNIRDTAYPLGPTRLMLTDSEGNRYHIPDITTVGRRAYEVLAKVM
jgi:hypothetical protein